MSDVPLSLKERIQEDMKAALREGDRPRLSVVRLIMAAYKQREIDDQVELDDADIVGVLQKMTKQRRDSIEQYKAAAREDLADQERYELKVIATYMPEALDQAAVTAAIDTAMAEVGASSMRDMGKVMGLLKSRLQGRADMGAVSAAIKARLAS
ncbi:MAG: GatB/YqeY domain-containing protein [Gammaproteobacteria bacterium]|nr:MAG: GatB/YqeY domain-containing protein [Gammaproteobacteria bacterium]